MATTASSEQSQRLRDLLVETARIQLAAMSSVIKFWSGWAQSAEKYTQSISDELAVINEGGTTSESALSRLSDLTREYLRDLSKLPGVATDQFSGEIEKLSKKGARPRRAARAKR
jgi:hypothetical protein